MIEIGQKYKDKITGFEGIATGHVIYISGCNQTLLSPPVSATGEVISAQWFDDQRLTQTSTEALVLDNGSTPGCDMAAPRR